MTKYTVKSELTDTPWQIENRTKKNKFMADESASGKNVAPNPVEYLAGAVNSCISISAGMIANVHHLDVKNFKVTNQAITTKLGHGKSVVSEMLITVSLGFATCAPIAAPSPYPIVPRPPEVISVCGFLYL